MSLRDASTVIPGARLERASDGEGLALVEVKVDTADLLMLHADEDDASAPIDSARTISFMETFHRSCRTINGVRPGMLVADAQEALGPVVHIVTSEIESRQYVTFERQPAWLTIRIDYSGLFPAGTRQTTAYQPEARILSLSIARRN